MSTYVYMRLLESAPGRYDRGIRLLSFGRIEKLYAAVADAAVVGRATPRVLEIGCGTGNLTRALAARGAVVTAIDQNPDMLAIARGKLLQAAGVDLCEMAAVEIADRFPAESFDVVAASLVFSEMGADEQRYVLAAARKILQSGGRLVVADELRPRHWWQRVLYACVRAPIAAITYLLTQTTTAAVADLAEMVKEAGFELVEERRWGVSSMGLVVARKPPDAAPSEHRKDDVDAPR